MTLKAIRIPWRTMIAGFLSAGCMCLVLVGIHAAPADKADYWPLRKGNTWHIAATAAGKNIDQILTVTEVKQEGGASLATIDFNMNGQVINREVYRVTKNEISRVAGGPPGAGGKASPPLPIIKYPMAPGKSWKWSGSLTLSEQTVQATSTLSVSGPQTVKTPAGTFKALHVHNALVATYQGTKMEYPNDYWFAPGVGLVRQSAVMMNMKIEGNLTSYKVK